jgi:hypothetical protein
MPTRAELEKINALIADAAALCEACQEQFERINEELQQSLRETRLPPARVLLDEERARRKLFDARVRLSERKEALKRIVNEG